VNKGPALAIAKKVCSHDLWNLQDYELYLLTLTEERHIDDMKRYFTVIKEGNDAIIKLESKGEENGGGAVDRKRSRSVNNDLYRSRVAEGIRPIVFKFMLAPFRAGVMLEEMRGQRSFDYNKNLPGEKESDPLRWGCSKN
jgi:hypothetical protein